MGTNNVHSFVHLVDYIHSLRLTQIIHIMYQRICYLYFSVLYSNTTIESIILFYNYMQLAILEIYGYFSIMDTKLKIEKDQLLVVLKHVHVHVYVHVHYNTCTLYVREIHVYISDINEYSTVWSIYIYNIYIYIYTYMYMQGISLQLIVTTKYYKY